MEGIDFFNKVTSTARQAFRRKESDIPDNTKIALSALLIGIWILNNRLLAFRAGPVTISFAIIAIILAAYIMGPTWAALVGGLGNMVAALLWPMGGAFNPLIMLQWVFAGIIFGIFIYRERNRGNVKLLMNLIFASLIVYVGVQLLWMSWVLTRIFVDDFWTILWVLRAWPFAALMVAQIIIAWPLCKFLREPIERFLVVDTESDSSQEVTSAVDESAKEE